LEMRTQTFKLRERLSYCSSLGPVFRAIQAARHDSKAGPSVGRSSMRRLEAAGIRSFNDLSALNLEDLVKLGIRRDLAQQIYVYASRAEQGQLGLSPVAHKP
jgi:hypothetical protein